MLTLTLTHQVEVDTADKATSLRDRCAAWLEEQGAKVVSSQMAHGLSTFHVVGVDVASTQPFADTVEAVDEADAKAKVETKKKIVAEVRRI